MTDKNVDLVRRKLLTVVTAGLGVAGTTAMVVPFAGSLSPSEKAKAAGAPVEVDISKIEPGQQLTFEWRGKPVWVIQRTPEMLDQLASLDDTLVDPASVSDQQPEYAQNPTRSIRDDIIVLVGICTHLGCSPKFYPEIGPVDFDEQWKGGFLCACHGSKFDLAGRVYKGVPAPTNLEIPPHQYLSETKILIGDDTEIAS